MQKLRSVNTKFWDDPFTANLTTEEKLLFLYLLTNPLTNILGIYEITLRRISYDTGIKPEKAENILVTNFMEKGKAIWSKNYLILPNFLKNQNLNPAMQKGALKLFNNLPEWLRYSILEEAPTGYQRLREAILNIKGIGIEEEKEEEEEAEPDCGGIGGGKLDLKANGQITLGLFPDFWKRYPRKIDKGNALKSWTKLCNIKVKDRPKWVIIRDAIYNQKQTERWDDKDFIPYPATWLNQTRWIDDPETMVKPVTRSRETPKAAHGTRSENPDFADSPVEVIQMPFTNPKNKKQNEN